VTYSSIENKQAALQHWLDHCLGGDCRGLKFMEDTKGFKSTPLFAVINDKEIFVIVTSCEGSFGGNELSWKKATENLEYVFSLFSYTTLSVRCGGHAVWQSHL
jgi:hypothetical protein